MKNVLLTLAAVLAGLLAGCSSGSGNSNHLSTTPVLTSITVTPTTPSVAAGETQQFTATGNYSSGPTQDLTATATWSSSNTGVATIASGGLATTKTEGSVTITATVNSVPGTDVLTVTAPVLDSIAVTPADDSVPVGTLTQLTATGTYSDGSTQNLTASVTWTSSSTSVAAISASGIATALKVSSSPITVTATSGSGSTSVSGSTQLTVANASLTSIAISGAPTVTIANGTSYAFSAIGVYNDGSKRNITAQVTWSSLTPAVATIVATDGYAVSVTPGSTTITATLGSMNATAALVVTNATVSSIVIAPSGRIIEPLTTQPYTAIGIFSDSSQQNITQDVSWSSSNTAAATVSNTSPNIGVATALSSGGGLETTISATFESVTRSAPLNVSSATLTSITLTPSTSGMALGSALHMQAVGNFSDGSTKHIEPIATWSSSATGVATVSNQGVVTGVADGTAVVTCQLGSVSATANLTVEALTSIAITPASSTLAEGTWVDLVATGTLADTTVQNLTGSMTWTSSDTAAATIGSGSTSPGQAVGVAPGAATITAVFAGQVAVAQLTVTDATLISIAITPPTANITLGSNEQFSATGTFSDGTTQNLIGQVTWTSSDIDVAIINATGAISTSGMGTTMIGASLGGVSATPVRLTVRFQCSGSNLIPLC